MRTLDALLELVAPTRCAGCDLPGVLLCDRCAAAVVRIDAAEACRRCGAPDGARHCSECAGRSFAFARTRCAGVLTHPLARLVVLYKDAGERRLAPVLARLLADALGEWREWPDAVVGIPASRAAVARRGFDHGSLLARSLGETLGVPSPAALACAPRRDQRSLGRGGRAANAAGRMRLLAADLPPRVLLVDDVLTTGATLDAAAAVLREAGVEEVRAAAVARACQW